MRWTVLAKDARSARAMLDDDVDTPTYAAEEEWLGPLEGINTGDKYDNVLDENGEEVAFE
jgi:hypothetical protein